MQNREEENSNEPDDGIIISVDSPGEGTTEFTPSIKTEDFVSDDEPITEEDMIDGLDPEFATCSELACLLTTQDGTAYDLTSLDR